MRRLTQHKSGFLGGLVLLLLAALLGGCAPTRPAAQTPKNYVFWPKPPDAPRVQFLTSFSKASDVNAAKRTSFIESLAGAEPVADLPINKPYGLAMWNGIIYVCDITGNSIFVLDLKKQQTRVMGAQGQGKVQRAVDITVASDGTKYVAEASRAAIFVYDAAERFAGSFQVAEMNPVGVAVHGDELFVADFKGQTVRVLDRRSGKQLRTIGEEGAGDGQFVRPLALAIDADGNLLVTDVIRCRVQRFTRDGKFLQGWGQTGNRPGDFVRPKHIATASDGSVYVVDAAFNNVQAFDSEGKLMGYLGSPGTYPGAMDLPAGAWIQETDLELFAKYVHPAFKAERLLLITNQMGPHKVAVYALGQLKEGKTLNDLTGSRLLVQEPTPQGNLDPTTSRPISTTQPAEPSGRK